MVRDASVTKPVPSAEADSRCSTFPVPALTRWANESRRSAATDRLRLREFCKQTRDSRLFPLITSDRFTAVVVGLHCYRTLAPRFHWRHGSEDSPPLLLLRLPDRVR